MDGLPPFAPLREARKTDIADGVLLCRRHHMILHNNHWHIQRDEGTYWLRPPVTVDPTQTLLPMPSKSPPMLKLYADKSTAGRRAADIRTADRHTEDRHTDDKLTGDRRAGERRTG